MQTTRLSMGMPITVAIVGTDETALAATEEVFAYFDFVDRRFSTYKPTSEVMRVNRNECSLDSISDELAEVLELSEQTKQETNGYFDITLPDGTIDPSGLVKGWAIYNAAQLLYACGYENFFIDAGGDIQSSGVNDAGNAWSVGIKNPFKQDEIVKVVYPRGRGVATSGTYIRGDHIYNPHDSALAIKDIVSLTVIGKNVYEADRFATAAFAMGKDSINFIESRDDLAGYMIDAGGVATMTSNFNQYTHV